MRSTDDILALYKLRKAHLDPLHRAALDVRAAYYGDITLPLPELDRNEKPLVANFLFSAGEQKAMRVASTMPSLYYPSVSAGAPRADQRARERTLVNQAWWDHDRLKLKMRKRARYMVYYAGSPVMIRPHFTEKRPTWQIRSPLSALPPALDVGDVCPPDIIFTYGKSYAHVAAMYPAAVRAFGNSDRVRDGVVTILEYQDADECVLIALGERVDERGDGLYKMETIRTEIAVELERTENRVGRCTAVVTGGIGLEHARGSFDGTIGMWQALGKMMALEAIGMQRAIWPEEWLVSDPGGTGAKIVTNADPQQGITGLIEGGKLEVIKPEPSVFATSIMDRLERGLRIEGGIPAELGGESTSNIRTGRRGDQILSSVLDFPLQEAQELLAVGLQEEDKVAVAVDKAYFPTAKSIYISATAGEISYTAPELFETDTHFVKYSHAGVDAQGLVVELGQLVGTGLISKRSAMESHPAIEDAQSEFDRMTQEQLAQALLGGLQQMAQDPQMAPVIANVLKAVRASEVEIEDAVLMVHNDLQQMQAQAAQAQAAQQAQAAPGMPGAAGPEAQPGMAAPQASIGAPPQSLTNLTSLLQQLHRGQAVGPVPNQLGIAS